MGQTTDQSVLAEGKRSVLAGRPGVELLDYTPLATSSAKLGLARVSQKRVSSSTPGEPMGLKQRTRSTKPWGHRCFQSCLVCSSKPWRHKGPLEPPVSGFWINFWSLNLPLPYVFIM